MHTHHRVMRLHSWNGHEEIKGEDKQKYKKKSTTKNQHPECQLFCQQRASSMTTKKNKKAKKGSR